MRSHLTSQPANEGPALFVNIFLGNLFIYFFATIFATNCQPILQPISQTIVNQFCNQLSINVSTNCQSIVNYSATNSKNLTTNNGQNFRSLRSCFNASVTFFTLGGSRSVFIVTLFFLQKHGLKSLNIAL